MSAGEALEQARAWKAQGVMRRFGVIVAHRKLGFRANGMAVFRVPEELADAAGERLAEQEEVSHCYRRPRMPDWPYDFLRWSWPDGGGSQSVRRSNGSDWGWKSTRSSSRPPNTRRSPCAISTTVRKALRDDHVSLCMCGTRAGDGGAREAPKGWGGELMRFRVLNGPAVPCYNGFCA